jgi:hypothetical protein
MEFNNGDTFHTRCEGGRVRYDTTGLFGRGIRELPFLCYMHGTATIAFGSLAACVLYFQRNHMVLVVRGNNEKRN